MGQYFSAILANPEGPVSAETVSAAVSPDMLGQGLKLMEHGFVGNVFVSYVEELLTHDPQKVVWAGDYADDESSGANLSLFTSDDRYTLEQSELAQNYLARRESGTVTPEPTYMLNHTLKEFVDLRKLIPSSYGLTIHPLCILTAEGNGRGGGDYSRGTFMNLVGSWSRNVISMETAEYDVSEWNELYAPFIETSRVEQVEEITKLTDPEILTDIVTLDDEELALIAAHNPACSDEGRVFWSLTNAAR